MIIFKTEICIDMRDGFVKPSQAVMDFIELNLPTWKYEVSKILEKEFPLVVFPPVTIQIHYHYKHTNYEDIHIVAQTDGECSQKAIVHICLAQFNNGHIDYIQNNFKSYHQYYHQHFLRGILVKELE